MQAFRHENQKSFLQTKNGRNFSCRFLMLLGIAVGTRLILELSMRVTRRKGISYTRHSSSFTKRNQLSPTSFWLAVHPFFQERSSWIGLPIHLFIRWLSNGKVNYTTVLLFPHYTLKMGNINNRKEYSTKLLSGKNGQSHELQARCRCKSCGFESAKPCRL